VIEENGAMSALADEVLPLIRTRADLWRSRASNHGMQVFHAADILEAAMGVEDSKIVYDVTTRAIASACTVIARADDSDGVLGGACRALIDLHPKAAALAKPDVRKLVAWMIKFQFDGIVDYFNIDPVAYADALGAAGMRLYRDELDKVAARLGPEPGLDDRWGPSSFDWLTVDYNRERLAVLDKDVDAIVATHLKDGRVAAWYTDTAKALAEIGEFDLAIDYAQQGAMKDKGFQAAEAACYWRTLIAKHHPEQLTDVARLVFDRWATAPNAAALHDALGADWPEDRDQVMDALSVDARQAVIFARDTLKDVPLAWSLANELVLTDTQIWSELLKKYEKIDPLATLSVHRELVEDALVAADAAWYRRAARRLATMRRLAAGTDQAAEVDTYIAELREQHRRRPRLQAEFDRVGLP